MENKNILSKLKRFFKWLVLTNLGRIFLASLWTIFFIILDNLLWKYSNNYNGWLIWFIMIGITYLTGVTLVMIAYAWIINPIRDWKEKKKKQDK